MEEAREKSERAKREGGIVAQTRRLSPEEIHITQEAVSRSESEVAKAHGGRIPKGSQASVLQSLKAQQDTDKRYQQEKKEENPLQLEQKPLSKQDEENMKSLESERVVTQEEVSRIQSETSKHFGGITHKGSDAAILQSAKSKQDKEEERTRKQQSV